MKELIFVVQAYEKMEGASLIDGCSLELYCETANEAIERAKKIIKKKKYRINQVFEKKN